MLRKKAPLLSFQTLQIFPQAGEQGGLIPTGHRTSNRGHGRDRYCPLADRAQVPQE